MTHLEGFDEWDGAYVLGALSAVDRHAYEEHLSDCPACRAAVAELAMLPGLLGRIEPDSMPALLDEHQERTGPQEPPELPPGLRHLAGRVRRRRRWRTAAALGAATTALLLAPLLPVAVAPAALTAHLSPVAGSPMSAEARLTAEPWGLRIALDCHYPASPTVGRTSRYALYVTDRQGRSTLLSTWEEGPGRTARVVATTARSVHDVARLDVRKLASGAVVLAAPISADE
jgi:hypothetical protein